MRTSPGLVRLTRRRFATPRSAALVVVTLVALAAFIVAAAPRAMVGVIREEVAYQTGEIPPALRDLTGTMIHVPDVGPAHDADLTDGWDPGTASVFGDLAQRLDDTWQEFDPAVQAITAGAEFVVLTSALSARPATLPADAPNANIQLLADPTLRSDLALRDGTWPGAWAGSGPVEIVLAVEAAQRMHWPIGESRSAAGQFVLTPGADLDVVLVGTVEATDPDADRWQHLPGGALTATIFDDGNRRPEATAVAYVDPTGWPALAGSVLPGQAETTAWYPVDPDAATSTDPATLYASLTRATSDSVPLNEAGTARMRFDTDIVDVLGTALGRSGSATAILAIAAVGPLAVTVALVVLASVLIVRRRRTDLILMSARGAPLRRLRLLLAGEGLILGLPTAVVAAAAGIALTPFDAGPLSILLALGVCLVPPVALAASLRPAILTTERADLDTVRTGRARAIVEGIVALLAVAAVTVLVVRGVGSATDGVDPLVVLAPLLATVALALVVVRVHPLPIALALRAASRGRGAVALVGAARTLRDAAAGSTAVLAMLVAVAIAVFSSLVLATVDRGAVVAAERQVGADIRLTGPFLSSTQLDAMREVDGVADAAGVLVGDRASAAAPTGTETVTVTIVVTDTARLARIQDGMAGGLPADAVSVGADPVEAVASDAAHAALGGTEWDVDGDRVRVTATVERLLGVPAPQDFLVLDRVDYEQLRGVGFFPRTVLLEVADGADVESVATAAAAIIDGPHAVELLADRTAEIQASPAVTALRTALLSAVGLAVTLSIVAVLLVAGVTRDARARTIALLRVIGMARGGTRGIVAWEFVPLGVTSLIGGFALGALLPLLVLGAIDLRPFTGGATQPALALDPALTGALIGAVVVALAIAVVGGVLSARSTSITAVLRTEED